MEVLADPKDALNLIKALRKDEKMAELNLNSSSQARASRIVRSVRPVSTPSLPSPCCVLSSSSYSYQLYCAFSFSLCFFLQLLHIANIKRETKVFR